ncbi:vacuolar import and degradation protein-domain-containing protein, partial [Multifurca ochricompacta]
SFLCGYLCIRGLTDDWPELTTYFDAEIIGSRYGFLTRGWGADEEGDMVHWARFPAFRHVKNKLKAPHLTMDGYPGAVFMRWKERFLVPDHRVQDINGASFAGFYYVCVDFNSHAQAPTSPTRQVSQQTPVIREDPDTLPSQASVAPKPEPLGRTRTSSVHNDTTGSHRSTSTGTRSGPGVATMSGFYFHQNSEP